MNKSQLKWYSTTSIFGGMSQGVARQNTQTQNTQAQNIQTQNTQGQNTQSPKIPKIEIAILIK